MSTSRVKNMKSRSLKQIYRNWFCNVLTWLCAAAAKQAGNGVSEL